MLPILKYMLFAFFSLQLLAGTGIVAMNLDLTILKKGIKEGVGKRNRSFQFHCSTFNNLLCLLQQENGSLEGKINGLQIEIK